MSLQTPSTQTLAPGTYRITIVDTLITVNSINYNFVRWQDQTSLVNPRDVTLAEGQILSLFAVYEAETEPNAVTPYDNMLNSGSHTITMPATVVKGVDTYNFSHWEDNSINPQRTINLQSDKVVTATYTLAPTNWSLIISAGVGGTVSPSGTISGAQGTSTPPITATPSGGYVFDHWVFDGTSYTTNPISFTINDANSHTLSAVFAALPQYNLIITSGTGGSTNPSGTQSYVQGTVAQVSATPTAGYAFSHWLLDGVQYTTNPINVTMNASHNLEAVFVQLTHTLTISATTGGTTVPSGTQTYAYGTVVSVVAQAYAGYLFDHWLLDGVSNNANPVSVTMLANHTLQAVFSVITYSLAITSTAGGSTSPSGTQTYTQGTTVPVTAMANTGFTFDYWLLDGVDIGTVNPYTVTMNANHSLQAVFSALPATITLNVVAGTGGTVAPSGQLTLTVGQAYQFTETEGVGYNFDHWDLAGESKGSSTSIILVSTLAMDGQTLTALFSTEPPPQVTVTLAVSGNGTTDIAPGNQTFNVGDTVTITAIPQAGAIFNGWKLDGADYSTSNPLLLTVTADLNGKTLTADFTVPIQEAGFPIWMIIVGVGALIGSYVLVKK